MTSVHNDLFSFPVEKPFNPPKIYGFMAFIIIATHPSREEQRPGKGTRYKVVDGLLEHMYYNTAYGYSLQGFARSVTNLTGGNASHDSLLGIRKELALFINTFCFHEDNKLKDQAVIFLKDYVRPGLQSLKKVYNNTSMESEIANWISYINNCSEPDDVDDSDIPDLTKPDLTKVEGSTRYVHKLVTYEILKKVNDLFKVHFKEKSLSPESLIRDIDIIVADLNVRIKEMENRKTTRNNPQDLSSFTPPMQIVAKRRSRSSSSASPAMSSPSSLTGYTQILEANNEKKD